MKKLIISTVFLSTVTMHGSQVSQTLQNQLNTNPNAFHADLRAALNENSVTALDHVPVPRPSTLNEYVKDETKLLELGKALFWDVQMSDDQTIACGTCHNNAGADSRITNQIGFARTLRNQDGSKRGFDSFSNDSENDIEFRPNITLIPNNFPRNKKSDVRDFSSEFLRQTNTIVGSAGIQRDRIKNNGQRSFVPLVTLDRSDYKMPLAGESGVFLNTRRKAARNAPSVINAVYNYRVLWNGKAANSFNGNTPFGENDTRTTVFVTLPSGYLQQKSVHINNAALASQSMGSMNNPSEMTTEQQGLGSPGGHNLFMKLTRRRKLLTRHPLARQEVSPTDSVLGHLANPSGKGLTVADYKTMIQEAFQDRWWNNTTQKIVINFSNEFERNIKDLEDTSIEDFSQIEANFSLFFGLAIYKYESTLVSDDTPVDRYLNGDHTALNDSELIGLRIAAKEARCLNCHGGAEFTFASVSRIHSQGLTRNRRGDLIDEGFNNIGVTPTLDDLGVGEHGPKVKDGRVYEISEARKANNANLDLGADGAFKIPSLRNVALTAPYFHNGSESTLEDLIDFYFRGGNYRREDAANGHPIVGYSNDRTQESLITGLGILSGPKQDSFVGLNSATLNPGGLDDEDKGHLVDFLKALSDERVVYNRAPFDHPEIRIPHGHVGNSHQLTSTSRGVAKDNYFTLDAVGATGNPTPFETFNDKLGQ